RGAFEISRASLCGQLFRLSGYLTRQTKTPDGTRPMARMLDCMRCFPACCRLEQPKRMGVVSLPGRARGSASPRARKTLQPCACTSLRIAAGSFGAADFRHRACTAVLEHSRSVFCLAGSSNGRAVHGSSRDRTRNDAMADAGMAVLDSACRTDDGGQP